ncbi:hypothetical protein KDA00_03175, partial [Candidatus Saccharibacteria bacterium]|nr:hypothetical protein [Candidatus Saccharibacteria bacterium]
MVEVIFALLALATIAELTFSIIFLQLYLQRKRVIYLYFTIFTGIAIFWSIGTALMLFSRTTSAVFLGYWFFLIAPMLSTLFILYFCQQFIKGKTSIGYFWGVVFIIIYAALLAINNNLLRIEFSVSGLNYLYPNRLFYLFYGLYFIIYFDISIFILRQHNQSSDRYKYFQAKSIVYATGLTGTLGIFTNIFLPAIGTPQYVWMGPIFSLIFLTFSAIAMTKYKLFDVRSTILRSTSYIFSVIILISLYSGVVVGIFGRTILNENGSVLQWFSLSLITALVAVAFTPLQKFFNKVSNKLFYRDAYDTQVFLNEFNQAIVSTIDLSKLLSKASDVVQKYIKSETVVFAIRDSQGDSLRLISDSRNDVSKESLEQIRAYVHKSSEKLFVTDTVEDSDGDLKHLLQEANVGLLARITTDVSVEGNGYIILGYKKSGNIYNSQDIGALEIITNELAIAMQNALQFDEIQRFNVTLQDTVDDKTKQLRKSNEKLKQMDETKDEFISMASHQLRTPLTSVKGYLSMVIEGDAGDLNEMQHKLLDQAFVSSQRMVYLIADLLNVSRLRTGKFIIEP